MIIKLKVPGLARQGGAEFEAVALGVAGVTAVDGYPNRAAIAVEDMTRVEPLLNALRAAGWSVEPEGGDGGGEGLAERRYFVGGMTCRSCELSLEHAFGAMPGVKRVAASAASGEVKLTCVAGGEPTFAQLATALPDKRYRLSRSKDEAGAAGRARPPVLKVLGLIVGVLLLGEAAGQFGLFGGALAPEPAGFGAALLIGLVAGSSSCLAVAGGLLLSVVGKYGERHGGAATLGQRLRPALFFVAGRTVGYAALGGLIAALGAAVTPPPLVTGLIVLVAAFVMFVMGLDMLGIAPAWLKAALPRMPKGLGRRVLGADGGAHPLAPALLGAATFFLPCGFTQSLQLYAFTGGGFVQGALLLGGFAVGTIPALLALAIFKTAMKGKAGLFVMQAAGALVLLLGVWNMQNGLTLLGYPVQVIWAKRSPAAAGITAAPPRITGDLQIVTMTAGGPGGPFVPSALTVKAGIPVRWEVTGERVGGCLSGIVQSQLGINAPLRRGLNVIEFTPEAPGQYTYTCPMGMLYGTINVI
jgi:sulfite exporter TauE/SafE/copper chaperone CopZ